MATDSSVRRVDPEDVEPNPNNPRRYFKEATLDELRASIQKVGILVPLIVFEDPDRPSHYILLDGERRWTCAIDLGLSDVPVNIIPPPSDLDNILRMFNIHAVREEWPLISVALSLEQVIAKAGVNSDRELAELTGLKPATVRRAKRLLGLPPSELERIKAEAHLPRNRQVHREDLYLEILDATAALERVLPEVVHERGRDAIIRQLAAKREERTVRSVTDYRQIVRLMNGVDEGLVTRDRAANAAEALVDDVELSPTRVFEQLAQRAFERRALAERADSLTDALRGFQGATDVGRQLADALAPLQAEITRLIGT